MGDLVASQGNAVATAKDRQTTRSTDVLAQVVTFTLAGEEFGVPILEVREIIRMTDITPVPKAPPFVEGVINLRGQIIPVVDLRKRFGIAAEINEATTRIIVIEVNENVLGLIVDAVDEVLRIPADTISPPPALVAGGIGSEYIRGISHFNNKMIILIEMGRVFTHNEIDKLGDVA